MFVRGTKKMSVLFINLIVLVQKFWDPDDLSVSKMAPGGGLALELGSFNCFHRGLGGIFFKLGWN